MARRSRPRPARTWSIRTTIAGLLAIPVLAMFALWGLLASITIGKAVAERDDYSLASSVSTGTETVMTALETERGVTLQWLSSPAGTPAPALLPGIRKADDSAITAYERVFPRFLPTRKSVLAGLAQVAVIRRDVDTRKDTAAVAFQGYSTVIDGLLSAISKSTLPDESLDQHTMSALDAGQALERFSRELTLVEVAPSDHGQLPPADAALFATAVSEQRLLVQQTLEHASPQLDAALTRLYGSPLHGTVAKLESQIAAPASDPKTVRAAVAAFSAPAVAPAFLRQFQAASLAAVQPIQAEASQVSNTLFLEAGLAGGLGLVAVIGVALLAFRFGRRIRRELTDLHDGAAAMASELLPAMVERLSAGDDVDVTAASPPLAAGRITEIARVAQAFSAVQSTAVSAAVGQASLRQGVSKVFVNLSLRNQSILHRQLGMLDALERATDDPAALADLFRLDHLTTRMRRNAESLLILSGSATGRSWRDPVQLVDVLRAAVAEVEEYTRVSVSCPTAAAVAGPAANDVVHLLAELMENATSFSPPNTRVEARVEDVGSGVAVEIEDRGLGLTRSELAAINARLEDPPGFDLVATEHLGLFVIGQLAARHGISVALRRSHYGGVTAVVLLPHSLLLPRGGLPAALSGGLPAALSGGTAALPSAAGSNGSTAAGADGAALLALTGSVRPGPAQAGPGNGSNGSSGNRNGSNGAGGHPAVPASPRHAGPRGPFEPARGHAATGADPRPEPPAAPAQEAAPAAPAGAAAAPPAPPADGGPAGPPAPPADGGPAGPQAAGSTYRGLPRRVRQASLVPQLKSAGVVPEATAREASIRAASVLAPASSPAPAGGERSGGPPERSPENVFSTFSSLQDGWQRGREDALEGPRPDGRDPGSTVYGSTVNGSTVNGDSA